MNQSHLPELLLDTHALLWWLAEPDRLSPAAHQAIADPGHRVHVSAASGWEIATKARLGKLPAASELLDDLPQLLAAQGFEQLPITLRHGLHAGLYPMAHHDPFDRLLAAQAELGGLTLVSLDPALQAFPCNLLW
ncbi:MAG: type II toxin-antitoxin system VapC family toxin [Synechococcus sp.]